jgi:hypothetical protein
LPKIAVSAGRHRTQIQTSSSHRHADDVTSLPEPMLLFPFWQERGKLKSVNVSTQSLRSDVSQSESAKEHVKLQDAQATGTKPVGVAQLDQNVNIIHFLVASLFYQFSNTNPLHCYITRYTDTTERYS